MGKQITGIKSGAPDFAAIGRRRSGLLRSDPTLHFTEALAENGVEAENISGLLTNRLIISQLSLTSKEQLKYRVSFWSTSGFSDSDLNDDTFLGAAIVDLTRFSSSSETT